MPRKYKSKTKPSERSRKIAKFWNDRIVAGLKAKEDYTQKAEEVLAYFKDSDILFDRGALASKFMDFGAGTATVSVPKVAQLKASLGPRLYLPKPDRNLTARTDDGVHVALTRILETYINYVSREAKLSQEVRKTIDDAMLRGRGFLQTGWDDVRKCVSSWYVSSADIIIDPDVSDMGDAEWIAIRKKESFWRTKRRVDEKWRIKDLEDSIKAHGSTHDKVDIYDGKEKRTDVPFSNHILEYWVVLSKMGYGFRGFEMDEKKYDDSKDFCRIEIALDHEYPLSEGEWPIPLYLDREWPITKMDFVETPDSLWPSSIMGQVLPAQKAIDLLTSLRITSCKNRDRLVVFCDSRVEREIQDVLRKGTAADFIPLDVRKGHRLQDSVMVADFGAGSAETANEREFLIQQIEVTTGIMQAVTGAPQSGAQDRSATATQARMNAINARLADLQNKVEELLTDSGRKEAITIKLDLDVEEVSSYVKARDIGMYYISISLPGGAEIPVRDNRSKEERQEDPGGSLTLEYISPSASDYFEAPEEVGQAILVLWEDIQQLAPEDPKVAELLNALISTGMDQQTGLPNGIQLGVVSVETVWKDTAGFSDEEVMREVTYEIASGAGNKIDKATEQQNADYLVQTALPAMLQTGDVGGANAILEIRDKAYDVSDEHKVRFQPPQPQAQPQQGAA
mgnify:CR=1 FL=1